MVGTQTVQAGAVRLAYAVSGESDAAPMVLLHALGERAADWQPVADRFTERFRVFAFDLRGHGDSDWPGEYSFQLMRDDVACGPASHIDQDKIAAAAARIPRADLVTIPAG